MRAGLWIFVRQVSLQIVRKVRARFLGNGHCDLRRPYRKVLALPLHPPRVVSTEKFLVPIFYQV
jgi:hypothetical protein